MSETKRKEKKHVSIDENGHLTIELLGTTPPVSPEPTAADGNINSIPPLNLSDSPGPRRDPEAEVLGDEVDGSVASTSKPNTPPELVDSTDPAREAEMAEMVSIAQPLVMHGSIQRVSNDIPRNGSLNSLTDTPSPQSQIPISAMSGEFPSEPGPTLGRRQSTIPLRRASSNTAGIKLHSLQSYLCTVPHLSTLSAQELNSLKVMVREYDALDLVFDYGADVQHINVLVSGTVEVFMKHARAGEKRVGTITAPNLFGLNSIIFDEPSRFKMRVGSANTTLLLISKAQFLDLLPENPVLQRSIGAKLVDHMDVFQVFQDFCRSVFSVSNSRVDSGGREYYSGEGYSLDLNAILGSYVNLGNVIHPLLNSTKIDVGAWMYASRRLPSNITESFVLNLARSLPPFLATELSQSSNDTVERSMSFTAESLRVADPAAMAGIEVSYVPTSDRRRCAWRIGDKGNTMVLLREGFTDVLDFVTCFCIHLVESKKLRLRLQEMVAPSAIELLQGAIRQLASAKEEMNEESLQKIEHEVLEHLPLSKEEREGIMRIWPHSVLMKLNNILMHREEYVVKIDNSLSRRFDLDPYLQWALSLRRHVLRLLNRSETDSIPENVEIDILSSNTHSTKNLLCSFTRMKRDEILAWAQEHRKDVLRSNWFNEDDMLYYLQSQMMYRDVGLREEYKEKLRESGFVVIEDTSMTGLQVDVIDTSKLDPETVDPVLRDAVVNRHKCNAAPHFILNMDFAFGAQADGISRALILTFGHHIRSFNVVGKAGGLVGTRGDIQLPTELLFSKAVLGEDTTDEFRASGNQGLTEERLRELVGDTREILTGPVITIPGTLLQNPTLLRYYRKVFNCIGLEMEGSYFARQVEESIALDLLKDTTATRFAYYTSDMPLGSTDGNLAQKMRPTEGVPPMYAIIRAMLELTLKCE